MSDEGCFLLLSKICMIYGLNLGSRAVRALVRQLSSPHKYHYNLNLVLFYFSDPISRNESDSFPSNLNFLHLHFEFASQG